MATATKKAAAKKAPQKTKRNPPLEIVTRTFKDGRTTHWYKKDGQTLKGRGVTTLLGNGLPAPALIKWTGNTVAECALDERDIWEPLAERDRATAYEYLRSAADRDRDAAGNRGTQVHNLAEQIMNDEEVDVPDEILGHVDRFIEFMTDWQPEILLVEVVGINHKYNYAGKFDLYVKLDGWHADGRPAYVLLDIKTARSGVFEKDALQLTAYRHFDEIAEATEDGKCWDLAPMPQVDAVAVLHLSADAYRIVPVDPALDRQLFAQFLHAVRTAEFLGSGWSPQDKGWSKDIWAVAHEHLGPYPTF